MNKSLRSVIAISIGILLNLSLVAQSRFVSNSFMGTDYSQNVEVRNDRGSTTVSADDAAQQLNSFLKKVNPKEVKTLHKGFSKDKSSYYDIVQLASDTGNHRIFYYCESINGKYKVTKIRINERL